MNRYVNIARKLVRFPALLVIAVPWLKRNKKQRRQLLIGAGVVLLAIVVAGELAVDPRHLPWRPLDIDERAGFATDIKLAAVRIGPEAWCQRLVAGSAKLEARDLDALDDNDGCGWPTAMHLESSSGVTLSGNSAYAMRCPLAAGAHIWITSIDHRARDLLGSGLARVHHAGTYSCRRMYNRPSGRMSQHAYANAWDVTGFQLEDGRVISVEKHWRAGGPLQDFLRAVRDDACSVFRVVLGPDYNAQHNDHFHVDMGYGLRCK